jgi:hypothetical protein
MSGSEIAEAKIIDAIYRGACDPLEFVRALALIAELFGSPAVVLGETDKLRPELQLAIGVGVMDAPELVRYGQSFAHLDPMPRALAALAAGTVTTSNRIIPDGGRGSEFTNEYLLPLGVNESLSCPLLSTAGRFALLSVLRGDSGKTYDDDDVARL